MHRRPAHKPPSPSSAPGTTASGETAQTASCGGAYGITLVTGQFKGQQIGRMSGSGASYEGEIADPKAEKTYAGSAGVGATSMKLTGCALKVFCKSQTWKKQQARQALRKAAMSRPA